jgi:hypothetical protein
MKTNEFYCVACRKRVVISSDNICVAKLKNGRHALKASCKKCDCNLTKFIKDNSVSSMKSKFGKCSPGKSRKRSRSKKRSRSRSRRRSQ